MSLEAVVFRLAHVTENKVESLVNLTITIFIDPVYECISSIDIVVDSWAFENALECFLGVRLDDELFMRH